MRTSQGTEGVQPGFKAWLTAREIVEAELPEAPSVRSSAQLYVQKLRDEGSAHLWRQREFGRRGDGSRGRVKGDGIEIHYTALPLDAVVRYEARHRPEPAAAQPADKRLARLGTGILSVAEGGRLRAFIIQRLMAEPRSPVVAIRDRCAERFGAHVVVIAQGLPTLVPLPSFRTFQAFVQALRETGAVDARR